jgi:hypothetical protein
MSYGKYSTSAGAAGLCEYCPIPEAAFRRPFHIEHVIAWQHGGATELDNLSACLLDVQSEERTQPHR